MGRRPCSTAWRGVSATAIRPSMLVAVLLATLCVFGGISARASAATNQYAAAAQDPDGHSGDYWDVTSAGVVTPHGTAADPGSLSEPPAKPIVGMAAAPGGSGYWLVGSDGGVFSFGAPFYGSMGGHALNAPVVGMAATPNGKGYWLVGSDGGVFAFGDAPYDGSMAGHQLNAPIVGIAAGPDGKGYWLVGADGGVFTFGEQYFGSMGGRALSAPIVGMAATPDGKGYWLVGSDGNVYSFGDAGSYGSEAGRTLPEPVLGMAPSPDGRGYRLFDADGSAFDFGDFVPAPTSPPPAPTPPATGTTTLHSPRRHHSRQVRVEVRLEWRYDGRITRLHRVLELRVASRVRISLACHGRDCPSRARMRAATGPRRIRARLRAIERLSFRAGERLRVVFSRRGRRPLRVQFRFRDRHAPRQTLLGS